MELDAGIARLPRWILGLAAVGTLGVTGLLGIRTGGGFLLGAIGAWINLRLLVRAVDRIGRLATAETLRTSVPAAAAFGSSSS